MPAFTTLVNALFLPGKKILGATGMALRDNLLAVIEGDPTAPKVLDAALDTGAATTAGITWVGLRMAAASAGGVGTYMLGGATGSVTGGTAFGSTRAGSDLTPGGVQNPASNPVSIQISGGTRAGTWRAMGNYPSASGGAGANSLTLWLRIA